MSTYMKKCPHCKTCIGYGHGDPFKHLGSPLKKCNHCGKSYIDDDMIEWSISPLYRKIGYFFANNRWIILFLSIFFSGSPFTFFPALAVLFGLCWWYVSDQVKEYKNNSSERLSNAEYVEFLQNSNYPTKK